MKRFFSITILYILLLFFNLPVYGEPIAREFLLKNAYDNLISKKYEPAIKFFSQYINNYPDDKNILQIYFLLGESYRGNEEYQRAIELFKDMLVNMHLPEILNRKVNYSLACTYLSLNQIEKAMDEFAHITSVYPFSSEGLQSQLKVGDCFYDLKKYEQAVEVYYKVYNKISENKNLASSVPEIGNRLGAALFGARKFNEAIQIYEEIIIKYPDSKDILYIKINLGIVHIYSRNMEKARTILHEAAYSNIAQADIISEAYYWLGRAAYEDGSYEEAYNNFEKVLSLYPFYKNELTYNANLALARINIKMKKEKKAEEILNTLIKLPMERSIIPSAYYTLSEYYENQGKTINAISTYSKIIETASGINQINQKLVWEEWLLRTVTRYHLLIQKSQEEDFLASSLFIIAEAYSKLGYYDKAIEIYLKTTQDFSKNAFAMESWLKLSEIYLLYNNKDKINEISLQLEKMFPYSFNNYMDKIKLILAVSYYNSNSYDSSESMTQNVLKIAKSDEIKTNTYYLLGKISMKKGAFDKAIIYFQKLLNEFPASPILPKILYELAWINIKAKNFSSALDIMIQIQDNYPDFNPENIASIIGDLYYITGKYNLAAEQFIIIYEKSQKFTVKNHALYWLGWSYLSGKDFKNAKKFFEIYLNTNPMYKEKPFLYFTIAECNRALGEFLEASKAYTKIINGYDDKFKDQSMIGFEKAFIQDIKPLLSLKEIQLSTYEDTWLEGNIIKNISPEYIPGDFPFSFTERSLLKFRHPRITSIYYDTSRIYNPRDEITITLRGTPGQKATFDLGHTPKDINMDELSPGVYRSTFKLENELKNVEITAYLKSYDNFKDYLELNKKITIENHNSVQNFSPSDSSVEIIELNDISEDANGLSIDLKLYVLPTGIIEYIDVVKSSGNSNMDQIAINKIKNSKKYNAVKGTSSEQILRIFNIRVIFLQKNKSKNNNSKLIK